MRFLSSLSKNQLRGKRVFVRFDGNVPIKRGLVGESWRIQAIFPTIQFLRAAGARIILATHIGRPQGKKVAALSTQPLVALLQKKWPRSVHWMNQSFGTEVSHAVDALADGEILLLENVRFVHGEEGSDHVFAQKLASLADLFVEDGFAVAHRNSASLTVLPTLLPSYGGLLLEQEMRALNQLLDAPKKPFVVCMGGIKLETKIPVLQSLGKRATTITLGGLLFAPFFAAKGWSIGKTVVTLADITSAKKVQKKFSFLFPTDVIITQGKKKSIVPAHAIPKDAVIRDMGPATIAQYQKIIAQAKTVVWNGPMGYSEGGYSTGSRAIARAVAAATPHAHTVIGGGETIAEARGARILSRVSWVSTGGGALLTYLEGKSLPAIRILK